MPEIPPTVRSARPPLPLALIAWALAAGTVLSGCASTGESAPAGATPGTTLSAEQVADRFGYDRATATMSPVFALVAEYRDPRDGYARDLLARRCLAGVVEYRAVPPEKIPTFFDPRTAMPVFNEKVAATWGYPQYRATPSVDTAVPNDVEITPAIMSAMEACGAKADARLGTPPEADLKGIEIAGAEALDGNAQVKDAATRWRTCMAPAKVGDLPTDPGEMPSASVLTPGSETELEDGTRVPNPKVSASAREREVAVLDAQCRETSGYDQAILQARADAELAAIGRDVAAFEAARAAYVAYGKKVDAVIAELT
jgi:hypothetical protein